MVRMKLLYVFVFCCVFGYSQNSPTKSYTQTKKGIFINTDDGTLGVFPILEDAIRIQFSKDALDSLTELILTSKVNTPKFEVTENKLTIEIKAKRISAIFEKKTGKLYYTDAAGKQFLSEQVGSRKLVADNIHGEPCYVAEQSFESPSNESIFGLGQFQDGNFNLRNVTRQLTQVNTQIAIPFIYSSEGYGLLWHQYGLTDFNPSDNFIELKKQEQVKANDEIVEVTTTSGTQKIARNQSLYQGEFSVSENGDYNLFLDLGGMTNKHFVSIDGISVIDQTNLWLPPTTSKTLHLEKGTHEVQVICKSDDSPKLAWRLSNNVTTFRSPVTKMLDYVVFSGPSADSVIASYRNLSGQVPMLPKWAYGFWQCRERYTSSKHLVETVQEFRNRKLPMDVIVQDWQYWGDRGWGVPQFDKTNYPNPSGFIKEIHDLDAHFSISIWSNPDKNSDLGKEYVANNSFIADTKWLDYFNPQTRKDYWTTLKTNMFDNGVDAWWMDAVEPENDALKGEQTYLGLGDFYRLAYPLMVSKAVYEGQRETTDSKRVAILTRSAFPGQQKFGVINWSGDIGGTWDDYKRQIVAGQNFTITGFPYWTTDIGGFFRPGESQYTDEKFQELLTRWFQWGAFSPIFRVHGYQSETEPWKYGETVEANMRKMLNLRYQLLPYIYSEAWQVTNSESTMMRPLVMDFTTDEVAVAQPFQYMFGKSFLVAPVTEADAHHWNVYLPNTANWYNFYTGAYYKGGQTINTDAPLDTIPLYVKEGSIIPMGPIIQHTNESTNEELEIFVYPGASAKFELYEDEGDSYNYEKGAYTIVPFMWDELTKTLTIGDRQGDFKNALKERRFKIIIVNDTNHFESATDKESKYITYTGKTLKYRL